MGYEIEFDLDALQDLKNPDRPVQQRLIGFLTQRVVTLDDPRDLGEPLAGTRLGNYWNYRMGDWRIVCDFQDRRIVVRVLRVGNRREVHR